MARRRPNFLFLLPDQHRFDWLGSTPGLPLRTPNLDALGARGVRFTHALCSSPLCAPSRACLASGREYDRCGVPDNRVDYPCDRSTYYRQLRDGAGYHVAGVGKFDLHKGSPIWGRDGRARLSEWGFSAGIDNAGKMDAISSGALEPLDPYMAYLHAHGLAAMHVADFRGRGGYRGTEPTPLPEEAYCDNWIGANGLTLLREFPRDRPWHLVVNFTGPHSPLDVTRTMAQWYAHASFPQPHAAPGEGGRPGTLGLDADLLQQIRRNYSAMVENIDRWVGVYLDEVQRRGELADTLVVYSSDHGEMLGDHGLWGKSQPYQPSVGIPLVVAGPGVAEATLSPAPVSLIDVAATLLDYAGLPRPDDMDALSLRPLLEGRTRTVRSFVRSGLGAWRLVFDGRYKLISGYAPRRAEAAPATMLFDLDADPWEDRDIAAEAPGVVRALTAQLESGPGNAEAGR